MQTLNTFPAITISDECYDTIGLAGTESSQARSDIQALRSGEKTEAEFRAECLRGVHKILINDWNEYVDAVVAAAKSDGIE